jgi:DNA polymerase-1
MIALIDGDELAYKACTTPIKTLNEADEIEVFDIEILSDVVDNAKAFINTWMEKTEATDCVICLSCEDRKLYRKQFYPAYKSNRGTEKPRFYWELINYLKENYEWVEEAGLEADDVLGILHTGVYPDSIMVSSDKDMDTVPGKRYSPYHDRFTEVTEHMADMNWLAQSLSGDSSDGYSGAKGVGKMGALKLLSIPRMARNLDFAFEHVVGMFERRGHSKEEAFGNLICARILRCSDVQRTNSGLVIYIPCMFDSPIYVTSILANMQNG